MQDLVDPRAEAMFTEVNCRQDLILAIADLPLLERRIVDAMIFDQLKPHQVAKLYNLPAANVRELRDSALVKMRASLDAEGA